MNTDLTAVIDAYANAWSEPDHDRRLQLLDTCWTDDGVYCDPMAEVRGRAALARHIGEVMTRYPGMKIILTSGVDRHHDCLRFGWQLRLGDGTVATEGIDFGSVASDGRLSGITGFFGPLPALS